MHWDGIPRDRELCGVRTLLFPWETSWECCRRGFAGSWAGPGTDHPQLILGLWECWAGASVSCFCCSARKSFLFYSELCLGAGRSFSELDVGSSWPSQQFQSSVLSRADEESALTALLPWIWARFSHLVSPKPHGGMQAVTLQCVWPLQLQRGWRNEEIAICV